MLTALDGSEISTELEYQQENPLKLGYHCDLIEAIMDYNAKSAIDIKQWYLDGSLEEKLGITTSILRRHKVDNLWSLPKMWNGL